MDCKKAPKPFRVKGANTKCCVPSCQSNRQKDPLLSWHLFPSDPYLRNEWVRRIGPAGKTGSWQPKKHHKICGMHFNKTGNKGCKDRLPIFFNWKDFSVENTPMDQVDHVSSISVPTDSTLQETGAVNPSVSSRLTLVNRLQACLPENEMKPYIHKDHNYFASVEDDDSAVLKILEEKTRLLGSMLDINSDLEKRNEELVNENRELQRKLSLLESKCSEQEANLEIQTMKLAQKTFRLSSVIDDAKVVRFYTGFESGECLSKFLDFVVEGYEQTFPSNKQTGRPLALDNHNQIFLVLCRLRLGFREEDLAQRFEISKTTVSKLWNIWASFILSYLSSVPSWPGEKQVKYLCPSRLNEIIKELQLFRSANRKSRMVTNM